jgi:hypothetical protein
MKISPNLRHHAMIALLVSAAGIVLTPGIASADLLVNDLSDRAMPQGVTPQTPGHVAPAVAFCPRGPAAVEQEGPGDAGMLLALLGVCVHPPINPPPANPPPGDPGGGVISSSSGGGGGGGTGTIASVSPEPGSLLIGLIGAGLVGFGEIVRRKRLTRLA